MKSILTKSLLTCSFSILCSMVFAQFEPKQPDPKPQQNPEVVEPNKDVVYEIVDEPAEFPGGLEALKKYMAENLKYPETAKEKGLEGKCYIQFVVSLDGKISNVKIRKGVVDCPECDKEAVRMVEAMPLWKPGKVNGRAVSSLFSLPVLFKLS